MQENPAGLWGHYSMNQKYRIPKWIWRYGLLEHFLSQWKCLPSAWVYLDIQICSCFLLDSKGWQDFYIKIFKIKLYCAKLPSTDFSLVLKYVLFHMFFIYIILMPLGLNVKFISKYIVIHINIDLYLNYLLYKI